MALPACDKVREPVAASVGVEVDLRTPVCETRHVRSQSVPIVIKGGCGAVTFLRFSPDGASCVALIVLLA